MDQVHEFVSYMCRTSERWWLGGTTLIALLILTGAIATSPATASPSAVGMSGPTDPPPGFELRGSGGYEVEVYGAAATESSAARVIVRAANRGGTATYDFPGTVEDDAIRADLGAFGEIAVAFHPASGGSSVAESGCARTLSSAAGWYEGTISFHADGLTSVEAPRAEGDDGLALSVMCAEEAQAKERPPGIYLDLGGGPRRTSVTALREKGGVATQIEAGVTEVRGGVVIERSVTVAAGAEALRHLGLRSASLRPPAPFTGSATFRRDGRRTSLKGNLRVDFPGRPGVALTGTGIGAQLRRVG